MARSDEEYRKTLLKRGIGVFGVFTWIISSVILIFRESFSGMSFLLDWLDAVMLLPAAGATLAAGLFTYFVLNKLFLQRRNGENNLIVLGLAFLSMAGFGILIVGAGGLLLSGATPLIFITHNIPSIGLNLGQALLAIGGGVVGLTAVLGIGLRCCLDPPESCFRGAPRPTQPLLGNDGQNSWGNNNIRLGSPYNYSATGKSLEQPTADQSQLGRAGNGYGTSTPPPANSNKLQRPSFVRDEYNRDQLPIPARSDLEKPRSGGGVCTADGVTWTGPRATDY